VLGPEKQIHVFRQPAGEGFAEQSIDGPGGRLTSSAVPEFTIDLDALLAD